MTIENLSIISGSNSYHESSYGIYIASSTYTSILSVNVTGQDTNSGILLDHSTHNRIIDSKVSNFWNAIVLNASPFNLVSRNLLDALATGIIFEWSSNNNTIMENQMQDCSYYGVYFPESSNYNLIADNNIINYYGVFF